MTDQPHRCGIVGYGRIGRLYHDLIRSGKELVVTDIAESVPSQQDKACRLWRDYRDLLANDIEAVLITTPPGSHFEIAKAALCSGKDVLVEKPPARTARECEELIKLSHASKAVLFFVYHASYNRAVLDAGNGIAEQRVRDVKIVYQENVLRYHSVGSWVFREGVWRDSGINAISVLTRLLPNSTLIPREATASRSAPELGPDQVNALLSLGGRGTVSIDLDWHYDGAEIRSLSFETDRELWSIDVVAGQLYRMASLRIRNRADSFRANTKRCFVTSLRG